MRKNFSPFLLPAAFFTIFISLNFLYSEPSGKASVNNVKKQFSPGKISGDYRKDLPNYDLAPEKITVNAENFILITIKNKGNSPIPDDLLKKIKITIQIDGQYKILPITGQTDIKMRLPGDSGKKLLAPASELIINTGLKLNKKSLVEAFLDSDNILQESDEQNNKLRAWLEPVKTISEGTSIKVIKSGHISKEKLKMADLPDLKIEKAEIVYADELKHKADLIVQIKNIGSKESAPIDYLVEIKNDLHDWKPLSVGSGQWKYLKPEETAEEKETGFFYLNFLNSQNYFIPGENLVRITLDPQNKQKEIKKDNNSLTINFRPLMPDLKITSFNLETKDLSDGTSEAIVHLTIKNAGNAYPLRREVNNVDGLTFKEQNFLNLNIKRSDKKNLTINLAVPNLSDSNLKDYLLAPGSSKEFNLSLPQTSIYDRDSPTGYTSVRSRLSNNFLLGEINITFTIDEGQLLFDADYSNNSFTYNYSKPPVFKLHPQSPSAYVNLEEYMNFYLISNLDLDNHHRGDVLGSGMGPDLSFYWGNEPIKIKSVNLLRSIEEKYKVSEEPVWEVRGEMPKAEGKEELRASWGKEDFPLSKIRIYGPPFITDYPDELIEPGKKYSFKGKNFISPEYFGKMFQNYQVKLEGGGYQWPYYFVSENEFQTYEPNPNFVCNSAPYPKVDLIITKSFSGKPENEVRVAFFTFGLTLKPEIVSIEPWTARPGQSIKITVENYCVDWPLKITEFKLNDLRLEEISRRSLGHGAIFTLNLPEGATSGKITCKYGNVVIESPVELVIKKD
ncbi:MAG: hypothetical protein ACPLZD_10490 [Candidatus Saccharicenans sp.]